MASSRERGSQKEASQTRSQIFFTKRDAVCIFSASTAILFVIALTTYFTYASDSKPSSSALTSTETTGDICSRGRTVIFYVFSNNHEQYMANLRYFVRHGIVLGDECADYWVVINGYNGTDLPELPEGMEYVHHENACFDTGTVGWLRNQEVYKTKTGDKNYTYFVWVNASVRGPFLPVYMPAGTKWYELLTSRLNDVVKLVGTTISCDINPHVQGMVIATDRVGIQILTAANVFECHQRYWEDAVLVGEVGASHAIYTAGYNLDCLEIKLQGIDWRDPPTACSSRMDEHWPGPGAHQYFNGPFGQGLNPLEVMFVKLSEVYYDFQNAQFAQLYDLWQFPRERFDWRWYVERNQLTDQGLNADQAWDHFKNGGSKAGLPYRLCSPGEPCSS